MFKGDEGYLENIINIILLMAVYISYVTDMRYKKIPNAVTFPSVLLGLALNILLFGSFSSGVIFSVKGLVLGFVLFFIPYLLGFFGAGDVKLFAAIGALKGAEFAFYNFLSVSVAGGIMAGVSLLMNRRFSAALKKFFFLLLFRVSVFKKLEEADASEKMSYGAAVFWGTLFNLLYFGVYKKYVL